MKTVQLTEPEWKALLSFIDELGNYQSNAGCNDLSKHIEELFTPEEGEQVAKEFAYYNNPKEPNGPSWPLYDSCLLSLIEHKIKRQL